MPSVTHLALPFPPTMPQPCRPIRRIVNTLPFPPLSFEASSFQFPLHQAALVGQFDVFEELIRLGFDINEHDESGVRAGGSVRAGGRVPCGCVSMTQGSVSRGAVWGCIVGDAE